MRVYGRLTNESGVKTWYTVTTDANGFNDAVYLTALAQVLKLNLNESPIFSNFGIPQQPTIVSQVYPDFYVTFIQRQYQKYFASLSITRIQNSSPPTYQINAVTNAGSLISITSTNGALPT